MFSTGAATDALLRGPDSACAAFSPRTALTFVFVCNAHSPISVLLLMCAGASIDALSRGPHGACAGHSPCAVLGGQDCAQLHQGGRSHEEEDQEGADQEEPRGP